MSDERLLHQFMQDVEAEAMRDGTLSREAYERAQEIRRIGNRAVRKAQEESRRLGVPNVYSINGTIYYERPDGTLTMEDPYVEE